MFGWAVAKSSTAGLGRAARVVAGAGLLRFGRPLVGEIAVEVVLVVGEEVGRRDRAAVEVGDLAFGVELVVGAGVLGLARHHHRRVQRRAVVAAQLDEFTVRVGLAHGAGEAVAVDVCALPVRMAAVRAIVDRAGTHIAAAFEHLFGAVGREARHHIEECVLQHFGHVRREGLAAHLECAAMQCDEILGDGQSHGGAADLGRVHVAVDPDRRPCAVGVAADGQQGNVAALGTAADGAQAGDVRMLPGPRGELVGDFGVVEVLLSEHARALAGGSGAALEAAILNHRAGNEASRSGVTGAPRTPGRRSGRHLLELEARTIDCPLPCAFAAHTIGTSRMHRRGAGS